MHIKIDAYNVEILIYAQCPTMKVLLLVHVLIKEYCMTISICLLRVIHLMHIKKGAI
jgi:hypothetical protein